MKLLILSLVSLFIYSTAIASPQHLGTYIEPTKTGFLVDFESQCEDGDYIADDEEDPTGRGYCQYEAENTIELSNSSGGYNLKINTFGSGLHTCDFESAAKFNGKNKYTATGEGMNINGKVAQCVLVMTVLPDQTSASVKTNGNCLNHCGLRARLEIKKAVKQTADSAK